MKVLVRLRRVRSRLRCVLMGGHYPLLHVECANGEVRMCLRCSFCGHESPGWRFGKACL